MRRPACPIPHRHSSDYPHFFLYLRCNSPGVRLDTSGEMIPRFFSSSLASRSTNGVRARTQFGSCFVAKWLRYFAEQQWNVGPPTGSGGPQLA